jgi:penicillin-binding protein 2
LNPLLNRATYGTYSPGSTFKMVTAFTGIRTGTITQYTTIEDQGRYTKYEDYQPACWIYPGSHGQMTVVSAIENSCNYFFYWLGDVLKNQDIADTATEFGLGCKTGIEVSERTGTVASATYKGENLNDQWYPADSLQAAIGQSYNLFTPIQIANYIATIANGGTHYDLHLLHSVRNYDYTESVYDQSPVAANIIDNSNGYLEILQQGMRAVAKTGTASAVFGSYPYSIAAKTGTVQLGQESTNNAVFVCYAPYDDPQIAIAVVVEKGGSGSDIMGVAEDILDYYFGSVSVDSSYVGENTLIK